MDNLSNKKYGRSISQDCLLMQEKYSIHRGMCQIPVFFTVDAEINTELLKKAIDIEIERNDALRDKIFYDKKHDIFEQTFVAPYKYEEHNGKIQEFDFRGKTKAEQDKCLQKLASTIVDYRKFDLLRVAFIKTYDNKFGLLFVASHIVCDSWGTFVTLTDILDVYNALENNTEMPKPLASFEECLEKDILSQSSERDAIDRKFIFDYYDSLGTPKEYSGIIDKRLPYKKREGKNAYNFILNSIKALIFDKSKNYVKVYPKEEFVVWEKFCEENGVSFSTLFMFGLMSYLAKINDNNDVIVSYICSRRATLSDKHSAGCRMNPILPRFKFNDTDTVEYMLNSITETMNQNFRHSGFSPRMLISDGVDKRYNISAYNHYGNTMTTSLNMPYQAPKGWNCDFNILSVGHYALPQYVIAIVDMVGNLKINVEYQLAYTNEIQVKATIAGICDSISAAVSDKNKTYKQIKDSIK